MLDQMPTSVRPWLTCSSLGCTAILGAFLVVATATRLGAAENEAGDSGVRTWTDASGTYKVAAAFLGLREDKVRLKKENGSIIEVPLAKLSVVDRGQAQALQAKLDAASKARPQAVNPFENSPAEADTPSLQELTRRVEGGIVFVASRDQFGSQIGLGSGFVMDGSGLVATNYHVIKDAASAWVKFRDGTEVEVTGYRLLDKKHDLALLQLKTSPKSVAVLKVETKDELKQGDAILAIGHPGGFEFTVSNGIISAIRKTAEMPEQVQPYLASDPECVWVQISAPSAAGSSGGPLLNARGRVVGVVTLVAPRQNIAFAVHAQHLAALHSRVSDKVYPLPVPGSFQGPGVSEPPILEQLAQFRHDLELMFARLQSVVSDEKRQEIYETENPVPAHVVKFRKLAESQAGTRVEFEALVTIARLADESANSQETQQTRRWAYGRLVEGHSGAEPLGGLMLELSKSASLDAQAFMREVVGRSPHQQVKGLGCLALGLALSGNPQTRGRAEAECVTWLERARTEFGTVEVGDTTLAEIVTPLAREAKSLAVGRPAAEVEGQDSNDQPFRLSDYRGKIVLLDFWVDWCPYCRAMYPHERALLEKHAGKPFTILGVNCEDRDRMRKVEASGAVTWRSWADGPGGPIAEQWNVTGYPTLYLIDGSGRIRRKGNLQGAVLDSAVDALVRELDLGLAHDLIEPSAVWNYYDDRAAPKPDWNVPGFDDSEWKSGRGILGYGQGDEATPLDFGPDEQAKTPTAYFRGTFDIKSPPTASGLVLGLLAAGGTAVYLNGQEVLRDNLAPGAQGGDLATGQPPDAGLTYRYFDVAAKHLRVGANVLAAEIHRSHPAQGDLRFDLTLSTKQEKKPVSNRDREGREATRVRGPALPNPVSIVTDPPGNLTGDVSRRFLDIVQASVARKDGRYVFSVVAAEAFPKPGEMEEGQCLDVMWLVDVDRDRSTGQSDLGNDYNIHLHLDKGGWQPWFFRVSPVTERDQVDVRNEDFIIDVRGREASLSFPAAYLQRNTFEWWASSSTHNAPTWPPLTENPVTQRATFDEHPTSPKPTAP